MPALECLADTILVHTYVKNPIAVHSPVTLSPVVPVRHFGGIFQIHPSGQEYVDQKEVVEDFGFTIVEERQNSGHTTLLVHGPHTALKALLQDPDIATLRVQLEFTIWPLRIGDPLTAGTIARGSTRTGTQAFH